MKIVWSMWCCEIWMDISKEEEQETGQLEDKFSFFDWNRKETKLILWTSVYNHLASYSSFRIDVDCWR